MKNFTEQFQRNAKTICLSSFERENLHDRLKTYMEYHPLLENQEFSGRFVERKKLSGGKLLNVWFVGKFAGAFSVLLLIILPTLAESSLPGETLYPIKVRFNEELRGALITSDYQKVEWETERLERRVSEAQLLADAGLLTPETEAEVAVAIKQHSDAAKKGIASIRETDAGEAALVEINLTSALEVTGEVLNRKDGEVKASASSTQSISKAVEDALNNISSHKDALTYEKLLFRIEAETTRAYEYLNSLDGTISGSERRDVERRLSDIKTKVDMVTTNNSETKLESVVVLAEALSSTRKLISFMTNLDVRNNVQVEDLVPVELNNDEKISLLEIKLQESSNSILEIEESLNKLATSTNDYIALEDSLIRYKELLSTASSSLKSGGVEDANSVLNEAVELASEIFVTLKALNADTGSKEE